MRCVLISLLTRVPRPHPAPDPEAGVAEALAHVHQRHCGSESHEREPLPEQHDHPEAAQRGGVRLLQWTDDSGQSQAPERQVLSRHKSTTDYGGSVRVTWSMLSDDDD